MSQDIKLIFIKFNTITQILCNILFCIKNDIIDLNSQLKDSYVRFLLDMDSNYF